MSTRRHFLQHSLTAAATLATARAAHGMGGPLRAEFGRGPEPLPDIQDSRVKELVQRALDAAKTAGANYTDVRLVHTRFRWIRGGVADFEWMTVGVRALRNGTWGFASSPVWSPEEMARLARQAVQQATMGSLGRTRVIELAPVATPANGHWDMPVAIDPFTVPVEEIQDFMRSMDFYMMNRALVRGYSGQTGTSECSLTVQEKAFGSSEGSYCTQRLFQTGGGFDWKISPSDNPNTAVALNMDYLPISGLGWELFRGQPLREYTDLILEDAIEDLTLPHRPVDIGRFDTVWNASSVAQLMSTTLGLATEADRVFGYEANATGTSYINDPLEMLGTFPVGSPFLTVTGNRTEVGGVSTARWDDDGVVPHDVTLVKDGILKDFSTTRESAGWLKDYYAKTSMPFRSNGCALGSQDVLGRGIHIPLARTPNLAMTPGTAALNFNTAVAGVGKGIAFRDMRIDMDFQQLSGLAIPGTAYEIQNGKRVSILDGLSVLFRAPELWKSLTAIGDASSQRRFGLRFVKGEPPQPTVQNVSAVPAVFKEVSVIATMRKDRFRGILNK